MLTKEMVMFILWFRVNGSHRVTIKIDVDDKESSRQIQKKHVTFLVWCCTMFWKDTWESYLEGNGSLCVNVIPFIGLVSICFSFQASLIDVINKTGLSAPLACASTHTKKLWSLKNYGQKYEETLLFQWLLGGVKTFKKKVPYLMLKCKVQASANQGTFL